MWIISYLDECMGTVIELFCSSSFPFFLFFFFVFGCLVVCLCFCFSYIHFLRGGEKGLIKILHSLIHLIKNCFLLHKQLQTTVVLFEWHYIFKLKLWTEINIMKNCSKTLELTGLYYAIRETFIPTDFIILFCNALWKI